MLDRTVNKGEGTQPARSVFCFDAIPNTSLQLFHARIHLNCHESTVGRERSSMDRGSANHAFERIRVSSHHASCAHISWSGWTIKGKTLADQLLIAKASAREFGIPIDLRHTLQMHLIDGVRAGHLNN